MNHESKGELREKGRMGLLYARNSSGKCVTAENAIAGELYTCPKCGCKVHLFTSKLGKRGFARNPGEQHRSDECRIYEAKSIKHTFENLDPNKFIESLCRAVPPTDDRDGSGAGGPKNPPSTDDGEMRTALFSSLSQIANEMDFFDDDTDQGAHKVSDFLLMYKYAKPYIMNCNHVLGARIIHCQYYWNVCKKRFLSFRLFEMDRNDEVDFSVGFCLEFPNSEDFSKHWSFFYSTVTSETGRSQCKVKSEKQRVLIASDNWEFLDRQKCRERCGLDSSCCKVCYGMFRAIFTSEKQFHYIDPKEISNS